MLNSDKLGIILKAIQNIAVTKTIFSSKSLPKEALDAIESYSKALGEFDWATYIKTESEVYDDKTPSQVLISNLRETINSQESHIMNLDKKLKKTEQDLLVSNGVFSELAKKVSAVNDIKYYKSEITTKDDTICELKSEIKRLQSIIASNVFPKIS